MTMPAKPDLSKKHFFLFPYYEWLAGRELIREQKFWAWVERPLPEEDPRPYDWEAMEAAMDRLIARGEDPNLDAAWFEIQAMKIEQIDRDVTAWVMKLVPEPARPWTGPPERVIPA